jgi:hypothetical protein
MKRGIDFFSGKEPARNLDRRHKKDLRGLLDSLRACINDPKFSDYARKYKRAEQEIIDTLIEFDEPDPVKYALAVKASLMSLRMARSLFKDLSTDFNAMNQRVKRAEEEDKNGEE